MKFAPIIGIPCRQDTSGRYHGRPVSAQNRSYIEAIIQAGGTPFLIPLELGKEALRDLYNLTDGILLCGGGDIDPSRYNQAIHPSVSDIQQERDRIEIDLAQWCVADGKATLGVCRGAQIMAVAAGGTLYQDLLSEMTDIEHHDYFYRNGGYPRDYLAHTIKVTPESRLAKIVETEVIKVNSFHHQAIKTVPAPYQIVAYASGGVPEAVDLPTHHFFFGVQWHPEELIYIEEPARKIFSAFINACNLQRK